MADEMSKEEVLERVKPWALVLKERLEAIDDPSKPRMTFGEMIGHYCALRGLDYPPKDVEHALLMAAAKRAFVGAPAPKGFA